MVVNPEAEEGATEAPQVKRGQEQGAEGEGAAESPQVKQGEEQGAEEEGAAEAPQAKQGEKRCAEEEGAAETPQAKQGEERGAEEEGAAEAPQVKQEEGASAAGEGEEEVLYSSDEEERRPLAPHVNNEATQLERKGETCLFFLPSTFPSNVGIRSSSVVRMAFSRLCQRMATTLIQTLIQHQPPQTLATQT